MAARDENSVPSFLLVDGNNIIHAWPELLDLHRRVPGSAYLELIRRLADFRDFSDERIVVVFDGRASAATEERPTPGLQVIYTSQSQTADDVIERLTTKYAGRYRITVATDDRAEQDLVVAAGGEVISAEGLRQRIEAGRRDLNDWIKRHRKR